MAEPPAMPHFVASAAPPRLDALKLAGALKSAGVRDSIVLSALAAVGEQLSDGDIAALGADEGAGGADAFGSTRASRDALPDPKAGWLKKRGVLNTAMKRRYFSLDGGYISWYDSMPPAAPAPMTWPLGRAPIRGVSASATGAPPQRTLSVALHAKPTRRHSSSIGSLLESAKASAKRGAKGGGRVLELEAESEAECAGWVSAIQEHAGWY